MFGGYTTMTKRQRIEHKQMVAKRRDHFLTIYFKTKPSVKGWIPNPGFAQRGKYAIV
jgi:hypothetical protein